MMELLGPRDKLEEAQYFLERMRTTPLGLEQPHPHAFIYYLSAFFNACYAVVEQAEADVKVALKVSRLPGQSGKKAKTGFLGLKTQWKDSRPPEDVEVWNNMEAWRGNDVHVRRIQTEIKTKNVPVRGSALPPAYGPDAFHVSQPVFTPGVIKRISLPPQWLDIFRTVEEHHFQIEGGETAVMEICGRYVFLLDSYITFLEQSIP